MIDLHHQKMFFSCYSSWVSTAFQSTSKPMGNKLLQPTHKDTKGSRKMTAGWLVLTTWPSDLFLDIWPRRNTAALYWWCISCWAGWGISDVQGIMESESNSSSVQVKYTLLTTYKAEALCLAYKFRLAASFENPCRVLTNSARAGRNFFFFFLFC